jgi:hypothetical protein
MSNDDNLKCNYCNKSYSTKYTKTRHEEKCKYIIEIDKLKEKIKYLEIENKELKNKQEIEYKYVNEYFKEENQEEVFNFSSLSGFNTPIEVPVVEVPIELPLEIKEEEINKNKFIYDFIENYICNIKNFNKINYKRQENKYNLYKIQKLKQINKK